MADGNITIDGREVAFEKGDTIIKAAYKSGIDIPHYCWHPGLSSPANCRMCLVEVEPPPGRPKMMLDVLQYDAQLNDYVPAKKPKLFPACQMNCADGMVVHSDTSETVVGARHAVQELLLLNHPVDCPICDQAGECDLQDYWLEHNRSKKRMTEEPVHKPKGAVFGETIVYDAERCIMCTRCIRVCDEVAKDPVLDMRERGNRNEIVLAQDRTLDHEYSLMTEHVCPVGALTSSHFRFKARVWFLRSGRTVCQGCATGCNAYLDYDPRDNTPYRYRPRDNEDVNGYWMCDEGMLSYTDAHEQRLLTAHVGGDDASLNEALEAAAEQLRDHADGSKNLAIVLSAEHNCEDNFALAYVAKHFLKASAFFISGRAAGQGDEVLMDSDKNANRAGVTEIAEQLELGEVGSLKDLLSRIDEGKIDYAIAFGSSVDVDAAELRKGCLGLKGTVAVCSHDGPLASAAHIAFPATAWAETAGTYVNRQGMHQRVDAILQARGDAHPAWQLIIAMARKLGYEIPIGKRSELEALMLESAAPKASATSVAASEEQGERA